MLRAVKSAAIVVIGDEILSGKFVEENAAFLIRELRDLGVSLRRVVFVPDVVEDIAETVELCARRYDHVFTSGGVGPTHDDLTMEGVARAFGGRVVRSERLEELLRGYYGASLVERNLRMADVPEGAELLDAGLPAWPVAAFRNVYILPGVPSIFRAKFTAIRERFREAPWHTRRVYCQSDEGALAAHLDAIVAAFPGVSVGSYPRLERVEFKVIVTIEGKDAAVVDRATDELVRRLPEGVVVNKE
jgi:molybdenum cofactor synthesis domain-containing protein